MGFSRQKYWSGLPCPPPGDLPSLGIEPVSLKVPYIGRQVLYAQGCLGSPGLGEVPPYLVASSFRSLYFRIICSFLVFFFFAHHSALLTELAKTKTFVTEVSLTMHALCVIHSKCSVHIDETAELMGMLTHGMDGWVGDRKVTVRFQARYHLSLSKAAIVCNVM